MVNFNWTVQEEIIYTMAKPSVFKKMLWELKSCTEELSEEEIIFNKDLVDWDSISRFQKLSKEFIIEYSERISFHSLLKNDNISQEVKDYCRMLL